MKKRVMALGCVAAVLIASASIGGAWSYFTTYAETSGERSIVLGDVTTIHEQEPVSDWTKKVTITSEKGSQPVYVRVQAFAGPQYQKLLQYDGSDWVKPAGEEYYYYTKPVVATEDAEGTTSELDIYLKDIPESLAPDDNDFNIVVVFESTPVIYQNGVAMENTKALWDIAVNADKTGGE